MENTFVLDSFQSINQEEAVVLHAVLCANVMDVHAPMDCLSEDQIQTGINLYSSLLNEVLSAEIKEACLALSSLIDGFGRDEDPSDFEIAEGLFERLDRHVNELAGHGSISSFALAR